MEDDITFYMQGWEPTGKPKAILCLVHGLSEHSGRYEHVGKALNEAGYALFGFDLRGHGKTGGQRGHMPSLDVALADIHQFIGFQKANFPDTPLFIYGHSFGGLLALAYILEHRDLLSGAVVTSAALHAQVLEKKNADKLVRFMGSLFPTLAVPAVFIDPKEISRDSAVVEGYVSDPLVHTKGSLGLGGVIVAAIEFCFAHARELTVPLLLMHGAEDQITNPRGSEDFAKRITETNEDVTLKLWDGLRHEIHNEPEQDDVFQFMIEWLDKHV